MNDFVVKDSGERRQFASGMVRDTDAGKTLWHLVASGPMLQRWAVHLTKGAEKYSENNWMKAEGEAEFNRFRASAFRHFMQWFLGDRDEDHAAAVMFNINGAEYVRDKMAKTADVVPFIRPAPPQAQKPNVVSAVLHVPPHKVPASDPHQPGQA